ncbi:SRPBCC family protein [Mycobacterium sp. NPDC048908]|uniref:SRPBCC family protein n=1 Tax=Mycobacterium sp. NPDC048908 TaxID=3364292 RepID=UPI0037147B88
MASKLAHVAAAAAVLYAARRYYRNWGTTKEECRMRLPGDEFVGGPGDQTTEAVWINAPASAVWPWLTQMGQDRGGLYSYETLENFVGLNYHNADHIYPEWQHLAVGDEMRLVPKGWLGLREGFTMRVIDIVEQQSIVLRSPSRNQSGDTVWSFHVIPHWEDRCRLMIRARTRLRHPGEVLVTELAGAAKALLTRGILLGVKRRAEGQIQGEAAAARASSRLHPAG